jgi:hypothetical protein
MAIASALQRGNVIYAYDEKGRQIFAKPGDALVGYTGSSVSIRKGNTVYTYNERGGQIMAKSVR